MPPCAVSTLAPKAPSGPAPRGSLRQRALSGSLWTFAGNGANQVLRLAANLVLTRLLFPEAFGLMALVNMINAGLQMTTNVGLRPAIIRHEHGDQSEFLDTAFSIQVLRGFGLWALGAAMAIPVARFYQEPALAALIPVATAGAAIDGFTSTKLVTLTRRIELGRTVAISVASKVFSILVMVAIALPFHTVWALVAGGLAAETSDMVLSHVAIPGRRDRLRWHPQYARELYHFGKWIVVSTLFTFLAQRIDVVMLGRLVPMELLGIYSIGVGLAAMPQQLFTSFSQVVLMPGLAESHRKRADQLERNLIAVKKLLLPAGALSVLAGATLAPAFFRFLYDPRYWGAGWIAQLAMVPLWFTILHDSNGRALLVIGDSRSFATSNAIRTVGSLGACLAGFFWLGLPGVLLGLGLGTALGYGFVAVALRSHGVGSQRADVVATALCGLASVACAVTPRVLEAPEDLSRVALLTLGAGLLLLLPLGAGFGAYAWRTLVVPARSGPS